MKQKVVDLLNVIFGFRKFLAWIGVFFVGIIFRIQALIDGAQFVDLMKNTFLAFVAANGVEHLLNTVKEYVNSKGQIIPAVPVADGDSVVPTDNPDQPKIGA